MCLLEQYNFNLTFLHNYSLSRNPFHPSKRKWRIFRFLKEIQGLVVERVTGHSFKDLYGLRASCKLMKALAERRTVYHFYDVLYVPQGLNMPAELLKTCYGERKPSALYINGVQFFFTLNLQEEGLCLIKLAADAGYECVVYTHAMNRKIIWDDDEDYFTRFPRESVARIGKVV